MSLKTVDFLVIVITIFVTSLAINTWYVVVTYGGKETRTQVELIKQCDGFGYLKCIYGKDAMKYRSIRSAGVFSIVALGLPFIYFRTTKKIRNA